MTVLNWNVLRSLKPDLNVEHADESELQRIEDAAEELAKIHSSEEIGELRDLRTAFDVAQKIIRLKSIQAEAAIEELESTMKNSTLAQENERLRRDLNHARRDELKGEDKFRDEIEELQRSLRREKQNSSRLESLYVEANQERKSLQVEVLALQTELDEKIKDPQKNETNAASQVSERQYIAKLKEKNDQITKLMLALQEEENLNEDLRSTIEQLGVKLRDATIEIDQSADLIEELQSAKQSLTRQSEQNLREIKTLEGLVDDYMDKINELEALQPSELMANNKDANNSSGDRLEAWRELLESKNAQIHLFECKCVQLERELENITSSSNVSTLNVLKRAVAEKDEQIESLAESLTQATQDIEDNARFIKSLKGELANKGENRPYEKKYKMNLRKLEEDNSQLEKQILDREEQLAEALLAAKKYEMGVYGLSDAVTEIRVCKRKITARDKNILRLQDQLAESYVVIERLKIENESLCQGILPLPKKPSPSKRDSIEAEKIILALEEEILELKENLRILQKNLVDKVHEVSADWGSPSGSQKSVDEEIVCTSFDEENFERCQISQLSPIPKQTSAVTEFADRSRPSSEIVTEKKHLKEFLVYVLQSLQKMNQQRNEKQNESSAEVIPKPRSRQKKASRVRLAKVTKSRKGETIRLLQLPADMKILKEFVRDILEENQLLVSDIKSLRHSIAHNDPNLQSLVFESAQKQILKQNALIGTYSGVIAEQMEYIDCIQDVYNRQLKALKTNEQLLQPNLVYTMTFDYVAELKEHIKLLNEDIVNIKNSLRDKEALASVIDYQDQTENMFLIEKLRMQIETLSHQYLKVQRIAAERQNELLQLHEQIREQTHSSGEEPKEEVSLKGPARTKDSDIDSSIEEVSQTESERSMSQSFFKRMDSLRDYNRKLCSELAEAKHILQRTQDGLKLKETMLKEVNKQHVSYGNLEQKLKVMEISLDTTKKLLGHKEQTLERYRQFVSDLKQNLISVKVECSARLQELEKKHITEMYLAKKQIAEITMKAFHQQKQLAMNNNDAVTDPNTFEKVLAEKQVLIVQLQNKLKAIQGNELFLQNQFDQMKNSNQNLNEIVSDLKEKLRHAEKPQSTVSGSIPEFVATSEAESVEGDHSDKSALSDENTKVIKQLKENLDKAERRIAKLKLANDAAKQKISSLQDKADQQNIKIEQLRKIQCRKRANPKRMKILEDEVDNLRKQLYDPTQRQRTEKTSEDVSKQIKQSVEVARWEESKKWQTLVETSREQLKANSATIEQLESNQSILKNQISRLEKEKYKLSDRLKANLSVGSENTQTIEALMRKVQSQEKLITSLQESTQRIRRRKPKENQIVPILVSPKSPRRHKGARSVSFDASVLDTEMLAEDEEVDDSRVDNEPIPCAISKM